MAYELGPFSDIGLDDGTLRRLLDEHDRRTVPALRRLWSYYRNPALDGPGAHCAGPRRRTAQEQGLPARLVSRRPTAADDRSPAHKEIVIENDIGWRIHAMVDFMAGRPISIVSHAREESTRRAVERVLDAAIEASGGVGLIQDMALLGAVYGHVDLLLRTDDLFASGARGRAPGDDDRRIERAARLAGLARIELLEPVRALPLLDPDDYRRVLAMIVRFERETPGAEEPRRDLRRALLDRIAPRGGRGREPGRTEVVEIHSASAWQRYEGGALVAEGAHRLGEAPIVHIQNVSQPFQYGGLSEVEPLIGLQDELNTRLSDRANRVTLQSFRMYLARGVEGFGDSPIGPGQVFVTDDPEARIDAIGGDASSPSEDRHIEELREAMDKASSVTPVAAGVLRAGLGRLSSENALRVTLLGALAKTARKHVAYGRGIAALCRMLLRAYDAAGVLRTDEADRGVSVVWPEPLPSSERDRLHAAEAKARLGVPRERVLAELGYGSGERGVE